jgi:hypothetical protein
MNTFFIVFMLMFPSGLSLYSGLPVYLAGIARRERCKTRLKATAGFYQKLKPRRHVAKTYFSCFF